MLVGEKRFFLYILGWGLIHCTQSVLIDQLFVIVSELLKILKKKSDYSDNYSLKHLSLFFLKNHILGKCRKIFFIFVKISKCAASWDYVLRDLKPISHMYANTNSF